MGLCRADGRRRLRNDGSHYGIYYTHNIWPVYADSLAYRAALILDKTDDARELKRIYDEARGDLLTAWNSGRLRIRPGTVTSLRYRAKRPEREVAGGCWRRFIRPDCCRPAIR